MRIEEYVKLLETMSTEEITELLLDIRRNRTTMTQSRIKAVREKTKNKNMKSMVAGMSEEEKAVLRKSLLASSNA